MYFPPLNSMLAVFASALSRPGFVFYENEANAINRSTEQIRHFIILFLMFNKCKDKRNSNLLENICCELVPNYSGYL